MSTLRQIFALASLVVAIVASAATPQWEVRTGRWKSADCEAAVDGVKYTCVSPGPNNSTVLRCTVSGVESIVFTVSYAGEAHHDYLTVGEIDTPCSRNLYRYSLRETNPGVEVHIDYRLPDAGEHYIEFCYSKDSSDDHYTDNATVYIAALTPSAGADVNGDGEVNIADAQRVLNIMSGVEGGNGDVNADGVVNIADVQRVLNVMVGL